MAERRRESVGRDPMETETFHPARSTGVRETVRRVNRFLKANIRDHKGPRESSPCQAALPAALGPLPGFELCKASSIWPLPPVPHGLGRAHYVGQQEQRPWQEARSAFGQLGGCQAKGSVGPGVQRQWVVDRPCQSRVSGEFDLCLEALRGRGSVLGVLEGRTLECAGLPACC